MRRGIKSREIKGLNMARNFNMIINKNSDNLHLKLSGDFDGTSAWERLNTVKENNHVRRRFLSIQAV